MPNSIYIKFKLTVLIFVLITAVYTLAFAGPIHDAAKSGDVATVEQLLAAGTDANERDAGFNTALHWASDKGQLDVVRLLVEKGADINAGTLTDRTPLGNAALARHADVVQFLIAKGADVNKLNEVGMSTLDDVTDWGVPDIVKMLKDAGAKCGTSDAYSRRCKEIEAQNE
jgi:ankyrin repeat protein